MRALGASRGAVAGLFFTEIALLALAAGVLGYLFGSLLADRIGQQVFGSGVGAVPALLPATLLLMIGVSLAGSAPSIWRAAHTDPAAVLREDV